MTPIMVPTAPGELIDKLTILRLKSERITDAAKRANVLHEMIELTQIADATLPTGAELARLWHDLYDINVRLWVIEDDIREHEALSDFGPAFIALARAVYQTNDRRAAVKRAINLLLGSEIVEEKSYFGSGAA